MPLLQTICRRVVFAAALSLLFTPSPIVSQEQSLRFEKYGVENGLPNEQILDILEDSFGFIWLATINGLVKFDGYNFKEYHHVPGDNSSIASPIVYQLMEDSKGSIWVVAQGGLNLYHRKTDNFELLLPAGYPDPPGNVVQVVFEDKDQVIWVGTVKGFFRFNNQDSSFLPVAKPVGMVENVNIRCIMQDSKGRIWVGGNHGPLKLDTCNNRLEPGFLISKNPNNPSRKPYIYDIEEDKHGRLWLATSTGTKIWDPAEKLLLPAPLPDSLANQSVRDILIDGKQNIWLAFQYKGLAFIDHNNYQTRHFQNSPYLPKGLANDQLYSLMLDRADNLWVGTTLGCQKIKLSSVKFPVYQVKAGMETSENEIFRIHQSNDGGIWITNINGRLFYASALGMKPRQLFYSDVPSAMNFTFYYSGFSNSLLGIRNINGVHNYNELNETWQRMDLGDTINKQPNMVLFEDKHDPGILWIGNVLGLCKLNKRTNQRQWFYPPDDIPSVSQLIHNMIQLPDGNILVNAGAFSTGTLVLFEQATGKFKPLIFSKDNPHQSAMVAVRNFTLTKKHGVWMATPTGLINYDIESGNCRIFTSNDDLPTTSVISVQSDKRDNIWVAYDGFLSKYMPSKDSMVSFDIRNEMSSFYSGSFAKGPDGRLFFGGSSGFMAFYPDSVYFDEAPPSVVLRSFKVLNRTRHFGTAPELISNITLSHRDNIFSFQFAALNFTDSKQNRYKYKLEGFNEEWVDAGTERTATYTNLNPDSYTFRVLAGNSEGVWNEKELSINLTITPPWWKTTWAYLLYVTLFFGILYTIYRFQLNRQLEYVENRRLKELDSVKTKLYTNITHEFRTPLTVILGMVKQVRENPKDWFNEGLQMIERNGKNLLNLVNQMLDLRKLESGTLSLKMVQGDLLTYLKYIIESFHSYAETKNIRLHFLCQSPELVMDYDPEKMLNIVSNLLSNAIKFTPDGGNVFISADLVQSEKLPTADCLLLTVKDTGIGIPSEKLPHIFDRFYQADDAATRAAEGTGIGLALTKELVKLLKGDISVQSQAEVGTTFTVVLPVTHTAALEEFPDMGELEEKVLPFVPVVADALHTKATATGPTEQPLVLLIEDNPDVIRYLTACLQQDYRIAVANNGQQGIEQAIERIPDLIVSDVMMPEKDGFEVTQDLKNDERTSHIPIILLTAKADIDSKMEGLERGADAYLSKPFHKEELLIRLKKLLELRQKLRQYYLSLVGSSEAAIPKPEEAVMEKTEDAFVKKVRAAVEEHLADFNFNVPQLCLELVMSYSQLHRKLTALTGYSTTKFIRYIRLSKAKTLLSETEETIAAVAYDTGFSDPVYFTRVFRKEFGVTPTEFKRRLLNAT